MNAISLVNGAVFDGTGAAPYRATVRIEHDRIVAVEPEGSAALRLALEAGEPVTLAPDTIASGLDAPYIGANAFVACRGHGVESLTVTDDDGATDTKDRRVDPKD